MAKKKSNNNDEESAEPEEKDIVEEDTDETPEQIGEDMEKGKKDEDVYSEEGDEKLVEDDEMEDWEEGFMEGAKGRGGKTSCAYCGKMVSENKKSIFEREFDGELKVFCSEEHAEKYAERLMKQKGKKEIPRKEK